MMRYETNLNTGEVTEHPDAPVIEQLIAPIAVETVSPVEKLRTFLASNPDVAELIK